MIFHQKRFLHINILFSMLMLFIFAGCGESGPELGTVSGFVTLDGEPLANASVGFTGVDNGPSCYGKTNAGGVYELK